MVSTKGPFALYWRIVIIVEALAVAEPIAPNKRQNDQGRPNKNRIPRITATIAVKASKIVKITDLIPFDFNRDNLKNRPTEKAIIANAISVITSSCLTVSTFISFKTEGPITIPASR